jgi:anti-sigma B factor antagonist
MQMEINIKKLPVSLLESGEESEITVVKLAGDIDGKTAPQVQAEVLPLAQPEIKMLLDMSQVLYMSSAGLRMLLSVYRQVTAKAGQVVLIGLAENLEDTMSMTGFLDFFTTCKTLDEGLTALKVQGTVASSNT